MNGLFFGLYMFICIVPTVWILYFYLYPKNWKDRKIILGVNNRKEFEQEGVAEEISLITEKTRRQALTISLICTAISVILLLFRGMFLQTFTWTSFIFLALFILSVPYLLGHRELLSVKRRLGITQDKGISYVDLKTAGNVHALGLSRVLIPNLIGALIAAVVLLADLRVINAPSYVQAGSFLGTLVTGTFFLTGLLMTVIGYLMDRLKNDVISTDSDINANYNRAKKKCWADLTTGWIWVNDLYLLAVAFMFLFSYNTSLIVLGSMIIYMIGIMAGIAFFVHQSGKIEERYKKERELFTDDDECWLGGMFYCNPADNRIMVEKRAGVGGTINLGHPVGKLLGILSLLIIIGSLLMIVWVGVIEVTPINLSVTDGKVICHQLRDEYVIPLEGIEDAELGDDITEHNVMRNSGVGMEGLLKGRFTVDGDPHCTLFLAPPSKVYIKILTTDGKLYYLSGATADETRAAFEAIEKK